MGEKSTQRRRQEGKRRVFTKKKKNKKSRVPKREREIEGRVKEREGGMVL